MLLFLHFDTNNDDQGNQQNACGTYILMYTKWIVLSVLSNYLNVQNLLIKLIKEILNITFKAFKGQVCGKVQM